MDDDFRILFDYVEQMKRELAEKDKADLQTKSAEDEEKKCVHESMETEEAYVHVSHVEMPLSKLFRERLVFVSETLQNMSILVMVDPHTTLLELVPCILFAHFASPLSAWLLVLNWRPLVSTNSRWQNGIFCSTNLHPCNWWCTWSSHLENA